MQGSVFGNTRDAFFWENLWKPFLWENIKNFFNIWARKFHFPKHKNFFFGGGEGSWIFFYFWVLGLICFRLLHFLLLYCIFFDRFLFLSLINGNSTTFLFNLLTIKSPFINSSNKSGNVSRRMQSLWYSSAHR